MKPKNLDIDQFTQIMLIFQKQHCCAIKIIQKGTLNMAHILFSDYIWPQFMETE